MKPKIWVASEEHGGVKVLEDEDITPATTRRTTMTTTTIQRMATSMVFKGRNLREELVDEDMTETTTSLYVHLTIKGHGDLGSLDFEALMMFSLQVLRFPCQEVINGPSLQHGIPLQGLPSKILPNLR
jgi:hypothetical protein